MNGYDLRPQYWVPEPDQGQEPDEAYDDELTWPDPLPACAGVRSRLRPLQSAQAATRFVHEVAPPRLRGITWSLVSAGPPQ